MSVFCATNAKLFLDIQFKTQVNKSISKGKKNSLTPLQSHLLVFDITHDTWGLTAAGWRDVSAHRQVI